MRAVGPSKCFAPTSNFTFNGIAVTVTCTTTQVYETGSGRLGLISTSKLALDSEHRRPGHRLRQGDRWRRVRQRRPAHGRDGGHPRQEQRHRGVDLRIGGDTAAPATSSARSLACRPDPNLGDCSAALATDGFGIGVTFAGESVTRTTECAHAVVVISRRSGLDGSPLLTLPRLPTFERPGSQSTIGSCNLYYPGRYLGSTPLVLSGGNRYFASGIYYFERPLQITDGVPTIVLGEGRTRGCSFDADARSCRQRLGPTRSPARAPPSSSVAAGRSPSPATTPPCG